MSIIVPPELDKIIGRLGRPTAVRRSVETVVANSRPAPRKPPRYGSLVSTTSVPGAGGFTATTSGVVAAGAEFGGRRRPKKTYVTHRKGTTYTVRRRTTMQFLPHNARGYALVPAMRSSMAGIRDRILLAVAAVVSGKGGR